MMIDQSQRTLKQSRQETKMIVYKLPDCQICLQPLQSQLVVLACGHIFHGDCLKQNEMHRKECCGCKRPYRNQDVKEIYFEAQKKARFMLGSKQALNDPEIKFAVKNFDEKMTNNRIYERFEVLKEKYLNLRKTHHLLNEQHQQAIQRIDYLQFQLEEFGQDGFQDDEFQDELSIDNSESEMQPEIERVNQTEQIENQINRYLGIVDQAFLENTHPSSEHQPGMNQQQDQQRQDSQESNESSQDSDQDQDIYESNGSPHLCQHCQNINCGQRSEEQQSSSEQSASNSCQRLLPQIIKNQRQNGAIHEEKVSNAELISQLEQKNKQIAKLKESSLEFQFQTTVRLENSSETIQKQQRLILQMSQTILELNQKIVQLANTVQRLQNSHSNHYKQQYSTNLINSTSYLQSISSQSSPSMFKPQILKEIRKNNSRIKTPFALKKIKPIKKMKKIAKSTKKRDWTVFSTKTKNSIPRVRILRKKLSKSQ